MKTSILSKRIFKRAKYTILSLLILWISSGYENCAGDSSASDCSGVGAPPPPAFHVWYSPEENGKAKFFFSCSQNVVLQTIYVTDSTDDFSDALSFQFPPLACNAGDTHIINEYQNVHIGQTWKFTFTGSSLSTGYSFSTAERLTLSGYSNKNK